MNQKNPIIVLTGGGSGGHITPLLSLAQELKNRSPECQIIYIGFAGDNLDTLKQVSHDFDFMAFIKAGKFRRYHTQSFLSSIFDIKTMALNIRDLFRLPGSIIASRRVLKKFKADVVFSKGGFVALPVGVAARTLHIPIITHDSDIAPGLANRMLSRWAKIHATGMPAKYYPYPSESIRFVGIPVDSSIKKVTPKIQNQAKNELDIPPENPVLLISGGGNGSMLINDLILKIVPELMENNLSLHIIHLTGEAHEANVKTSLKNLPKPIQKRVHVQAYSNDFQKLVAAADLIITRAGATTLSELAVAGKACIVLPAPFLAGGHQVKNAEELASRDAAVVVDQETDPEEILALINSLLDNDSRRFELAKNLYATTKNNAALELAKLILATAERR